MTLKVPPDADDFRLSGSDNQFQIDEVFVTFPG